MQIYVEHWGRWFSKIDHFLILGGWFSKIDTSADVQFFAHSEVKTEKKKGHNVPRYSIFCPWRPKKGHHLRWCPVLGMKILGGYIPPWISTHGYEEVGNCRKTLFIQSIVEWWGGVHPPHPPWICPCVLLNVCLLVLRLLFFEKFAGVPHGQKYKYGMGALHRAS